MQRLLAVLSLWLLTATIANAATVAGRVLNAETGDPIISANVVLENTRYGAATDIDGKFKISLVPRGVYTLRVTAINFENSIRENLVIEDDLEFIVRMIPSVMELKEVTFTAGAIMGSEEREIQERFEKIEIVDAISAEELKKLPDPDIADVVRRTTGVSTMKGDPVIRGLGVRYSKVTLNNAQVSGTEPNRSAVSLELFPSAMMSKVSVQKSYTPDQFGEFGGGYVNMNTWDIFSGDIDINFGSSVSYNTNSSFQNFYTYVGGKKDWLGIDDGTRDLPDSFSGPLFPGGEDPDAPSWAYSRPELVEISKSFNNTWQTFSVQAPLNQSYNLSLSNRMKIFNKPLDVMVSGSYKTNYEVTESVRNIYQIGANDELLVWHRYDNFDSYKNSITNGGLLSGRIQLNPFHNISFNSMLNRTAEIETRFFDGFNGDRVRWLRDYRLRFVSENTWTSQIAGSHTFPAFLMSNVEWRATYSRGDRDEPDTREIQWHKTEQELFYIYAKEAQSGSRIYNDLTDETYTYTLDWRVPIIEGDNKFFQFDLKTGGAYVNRHRDSETRLFEYQPQWEDLKSVEFLAQPAPVLFSDQNMNENTFVIWETTRPTDNYFADLDLAAGYMMLNWHLGKKVRGSIGARVEAMDQRVVSFNLWNRSEEQEVPSEIVVTDVLPAVTVIYSPIDRFNLRFASSQTVSRPDFREMSTFEFTDIIGGKAVVGDSTLTRGLIRNYDLRAEYNFAGANLVAASVFYKNFHQPIERVLLMTTQIMTSFDNAESAENYGLELEARIELGLIHPMLSSFGLSSNLALIHSRVNLGDDITGVQTSKERALQGQSPYLLNVNLNYTSKHLGTYAGIFLNTFGRRIMEAGANGRPDLYEEPHPELDLAVRQPLGKHFSISFGGGNLLDPKHEITQGGLMVEEFRKGRSFSVSFGWKN